MPSAKPPAAVSEVAMNWRQEFMHDRHGCSPAQIFISAAAR
jgi:hypothetical protein